MVVCPAVFVYFFDMARTILLGILAAGGLAAAIRPLFPLIMRQAVHMPPIVTLFSLVLWGQVFGLAGLLLAIPINLVIWNFASTFLKHDDA